MQNASPDGPLNGPFTVIPTRRKQSGGHPAIRLLCFQAPPPRHGALWGHCGADWGVFAPEGRSLGPPRGNLGRFCPWGAVFGASAGQISPFLPLKGGRWGHCGANQPVFAPEVQSLAPLRGKSARFCPWRAVVGATAGQFGPFLPLACSLCGHCGAI